MSDLHVTGKIMLHGTMTNFHIPIGDTNDPINVALAIVYGMLGYGSWTLQHQLNGNLRIFEGRDGRHVGDARITDNGKELQPV